MFIKVCFDCEYGTEKSGSSFCTKEAHSSFFTKCIQNKALETFFEKNSFSHGKHFSDGLLDSAGKHNET